MYENENTCAVQSAPSMGKLVGNGQRRDTTVDRLTRQKAELEEVLGRINKALELLEKHKELGEFLDLTRNIL